MAHGHAYTEGPELSGPRSHLRERTAGVRPFASMHVPKRTKPTSPTQTHSQDGKTHTASSANLKRAKGQWSKAHNQRS